MAVLKPAGIFKLLKKAFQEFRQNDPLRMAAATAFFANFALPPILIILVEIFGLFANPRTIRRNLFDQLGKVLGNNILSQIRETMHNVRNLKMSWLIAAGGFLFLIFIATTLFTIIRDSINQIWKIQLKKKPGIGFVLAYRAKSVAIIMAAGILFFGVTVAEATGTFIKEQISEGGYGPAIFFINLFKQFTTMLLVMVWFTLIFKFLADGRPNWKVAGAGGIFTGLLFTAGKLLLRSLLLHSNMQTIYGASASVVLLLLFVFYSSFIFYYGASFTKVWAEHFNQPIHPTRHAIQYTLEWKKVNDEV